MSQPLSYSRCAQTKSYSGFRERDEEIGIHLTVKNQGEKRDRCGESSYGRNAWLRKTVRQKESNGKEVCSLEAPVSIDITCNSLNPHISENRAGLREHKLESTTSQLLHCNQLFHHACRSCPSLPLRIFCKLSSSMS